MRVQPPFAPPRQERPCRETSSATGWRLTSGLFVGYLRSTTNPRGTLLGILGGSVPPGSSNPNPIYDEKMSSSTPVFRLDLKNPCPFSDLAEIMSSLLGLERKQKNSSNTFSHSSISFFHLELKRYTLTCDQAIFFLYVHTLP